MRGRKTLNVALLVAAIGFLPNCSAQCPLTRHVPAFRRGRQSRFDTLIRFGKENKISFGIESAPNLAEQKEISVPAGTVSSAVRAILDPAGAGLACLGSVIVIRDPNARQETWLNARLPEFRISRTTLGLADAALWMQVETILNPRPQGFAGDIPGIDPADLVGPFDIRRATARVLLCRLVESSSRGASWVAGGVQDFRGTSWRNRLWTLIPYGMPPKYAPPLGSGG